MGWGLSPEGTKMGSREAGPERSPDQGVAPDWGQEAKPRKPRVSTDKTRFCIMLHKHNRIKLVPACKGLMYQTLSTAADTCLSFTIQIGWVAAF